MEQDVPEERTHDTRTFVERVEQVNLGFIVSLPPEQLKPFAAAVDKVLAELQGVLRYTLDSSKRLSLREWRPKFGGDDRRGGDRRDDRRGDRRDNRSSFGGREGGRY